MGGAEGLTKFAYYAGMIRLAEGSAPDVKTAPLSQSPMSRFPRGRQRHADHARRFVRSWGLMLKDGRPDFTYNWLQEQVTHSPLQLH